MAGRETVTGLLIAGGQSARMAPAFAGTVGGDKGLLDLGGRPMLAHVIERLAPQAGRLVINANGDPGRFAPFGLPVISDPIHDFPGPLAGLLAGLRWSAVKAPETRYVASVPADVPFLPTDLVERLSRALAGQTQGVAVAASQSGVHPIIGLWPVALGDALESAIAAGMRKVHAFAEQCGMVAVPFDAATINGRAIDPFFNANTPEELAEARALLEPSS
jgi:molybdopterin-guanine dinucleotide biosynthesis protein A